MSKNAIPLLENSRLWFDLAKDGGRVILSFAIGAATYFGTPLHPLFRQYWPTIGLGCALIMAVYILVRREKQRATNFKAEGIVGAWPRREGLDQKRIFRALEKADSIDMLGYNLRSPYFSYGGTFDDLVREKLKREKTIRLRILIADPDSEGLARRAELEDRHPTDRMRNDGYSSLEYLNDLLRIYPGGSLEVKLIDGDSIRCSCIFADDSLFMTPYLARRTGNKCPAFEIFGENTGFYVTFQREFESLWNDAEPHSAP
jgi:hypothetical protein